MTLDYRTILSDDDIKKQLTITNINKQYELLLAFCKFATPIYWGENEYTEYEQIIELFLKNNTQQ